MRFLLCVAAAASGLPALAAAQDDVPPRFDVGLRAVLLLSRGQPANDMVGEGLVASMRVGDRWRVVATYDGVTFDYETPNRALGIAATTVVDGANDWSRFGLFAERRYESARTWDWYWRAGLASASLDPIGNVAGTRVGGGTFNIATLADDEVHLIAGGGLRRPLGRHWAVDATFTFEHHSTDYRLTDTVSGARGTIGTQSPYGLAFGVSYGFGR